MPDRAIWYIRFGVISVHVRGMGPPLLQTSFGVKKPDEPKADSPHIQKLATATTKFKKGSGAKHVKTPPDYTPASDDTVNHETGGHSNGGAAAVHHEAGAPHAAGDASHHAAGPSHAAGGATAHPEKGEHHAGGGATAHHAENEHPMAPTTPRPPKRTNSAGHLGNTVPHPPRRTKTMGPSMGLSVLAGEQPGAPPPGVTPDFLNDDGPTESDGEDPAPAPAPAGRRATMIAQQLNMSDDERNTHYVETFKGLFKGLDPENAQYDEDLLKVTTVTELHAFMATYANVVTDTIKNYVQSDIIEHGMPATHAKTLAAAIAENAVNGSGISIRKALEAATEFLESGNETSAIRRHMTNIKEKMLLHEKIDKNRIAKIRELKDAVRQMTEAGGEVGELRAEMAKLDAEIARLNAEVEKHALEMRKMLDELDVLISVMDIITTTLYSIAKTGTEWMERDAKYLDELETTVNALNLLGKDPNGPDLPEPPNYTKTNKGNANLDYPVPKTDDDEPFDPEDDTPVAPPGSANVDTPTDDSVDSHPVDVPPPTPGPDGPKLKADG